MTEQEAIENIRLDMCDKCLENCARTRKCTFSLAIKALEKQTPRKPLHDGCYDKNGKWHEWNGINGKSYELCPNCRKNLCCEMPNEKKPNFCDNCGQRLDWSDENETY